MNGDGPVHNEDGHDWPAGHEPWEGGDGLDPGSAFGDTPDWHQHDQDWPAEPNDPPDPDRDYPPSESFNAPSEAGQTIPVIPSAEEFGEAPPDPVSTGGGSAEGGGVWSAMFGVGGTDPLGQGDDSLPWLAPFESEADLVDDPDWTDWLAERGYTAESWVDPGLLGEGLPTRAPLGSDRELAVAELWRRLAPDAAAPLTSQGILNAEAALHQLAASAESPLVQAVVAVATTSWARGS